MTSPQAQRAGGAVGAKLLTPRRNWHESMKAPSERESLGLVGKVSRKAPAVRQAVLRRRAWCSGSVCAVRSAL